MRSLVLLLYVIRIKTIGRYISTFTNSIKLLTGEINQLSVIGSKNTYHLPSLCITSLSSHVAHARRSSCSKEHISYHTFLWNKSLKVMESSEVPKDMNMSPPESVRGMTKLDRNAFHKRVLVPSLLVPFRSIGKLSKIFQKGLIKCPGIKSVANVSDGNENGAKLFLFDPCKYKSIECFTEEEKQILLSGGVDLSTWKLCEMDLTYQNWSYDDILDAVLPSDSEGVGGFSIIGHIVHLNLRESLVMYKQIIGEVLLDKLPQALTVVNKMNIIDNTFRNFQMEVLAGKEDMVTTAKENGCSFQMDFAKVYWNPRLGTEHRRIVDLLETGDVVYDVFAGIGPFAVPASKKQCEVLANDLNPESYRWMQYNVQLNKVKEMPKMFNMDGRNFILEVLKPDLLNRWRKEKERDYSIHIIMNLPALAVEFLDTLPGLMSDVDCTELKSMELPIVHCYSFNKSNDPLNHPKVRAERALGRPLPDDHSIRFVRNVAPNKDMVCISFVVPKELLLQPLDTSLEEPKDLEGQPLLKKCKLK